MEELPEGAQSAQNLQPIFQRNPGKRIRGVNTKKYAEYMHKIERGEISESTLVRKKILLPGKGIGLKRDDKIFHYRSKVRGQNKPGKCLAPECNNEPSRRGLCNTHRVYAKRLVKRGKASETNLVNRGLLLPGDSTRISKPNLKRLPRRKTSGTHCLFPRCNKRRKTKGLCNKHYRMYLKKSSGLDSKKKKILERDLIRRRLLLPSIEEISDAKAFELGSKVKGIIHGA
jgi:hypothetical protein